MIRSLPLFAAAFLLLLPGCSQESGVHAEPTVLSEAVAYVASLPPYTKFYVWPARQLTHEVVGDPELQDAVKRFGLLGRPTKLVAVWGTIVQVSVLAVGENGGGDAVAGTRQTGGYRDIVARTPPPSDGCSAIKLLSRDTWMTTAMVFIDRSKLVDSTTAGLDECVFAGLDFAAGFPTPDTVFRYREMPSPEARRVILGAAYQCAREREGPADEVERTRDGMTPLPTLGCITGKLRDAVPEVPSTD